MRIGDKVKVCISGREPEDAIIKRFSFIGELALVNLINGGWMMVHKADLKEEGEGVK